MKLFKTKGIAIVMSVLLMTLSFGTAFSATALSDYDTHWANETIQSAIASGDVNGYPDMTFRPDQSISRAEFFALINNIFNYSATSDTTYSDVDANAWYANDVAVATHENYVNGYTDGTMKPEMSISRQEVAMILNNILSLTPASSTSSFKDAAQIPAWSNDSINAIEEVGIINGYPDGTFRPAAPISRAEALVAILNSYNFTPEPIALETTEPTTNTSTNPVSTEPSTEPTTEVTTQATTEATTVPSTTEAPDVSTLAPVELGMAGDFVILSKSGISTVPTSAITGNIGVSPIGSTAITGFSLTMDATNQFGTSSQLTGKAYASDYTSPTPSNLTTAISNMETAYVDAAGRAADFTELYAGDLSGKILTPGVYKWGTGISANTNVTFNGTANDVWILQISDGITIASGVNIILSGGAQAKNIFWQAADTVTIGTGAHFEGTILAQTNIAMGTNASINGRLYAQTAVTLDANTVVIK